MRGTTLTALSLFLAGSWLIYRSVLPDAYAIDAAAGVGLLLLSLGILVVRNFRGPKKAGGLRGRDNILAIVLTIAYFYGLAGFLSFFDRDVVKPGFLVASRLAIAVCVAVIWFSHDRWGVAQSGIAGIIGLAVYRFATANDALALSLGLGCAGLVIVLGFVERNFKQARSTGSKPQVADSVSD